MAKKHTKSNKNSKSDIKSKKISIVNKQKCEKVDNIKKKQRDIKHDKKIEEEKEMNISLDLYEHMYIPHNSKQNVAKVSKKKTSQSK